MWNVYLLENKIGGHVKQFNLSILILFLFYACGGGGGGGYNPPAEEQTGCVSSSTNFCVKVVSTAGGNKYSIDGTI